MRAVAVLLLLILLGSAPLFAGTGRIGCCICECSGGATLCGDTDSGCDAAAEFCMQVNASCAFDQVNGSCASVPACAAAGAAAAAPLVGSTGLTIMALLLGGFGMLQARRLRRRTGR